MLLLIILGLGMPALSQLGAGSPTTVTAQKKQTVSSKDYRFFHGDALPDRTVYLSFDDGPGPFTQQVLDVLKQENIKATFFVCSRWGQSLHSSGPSLFELYPEALERMVDEGHIIGNHTASHPNLMGLSQAQVLAELDINQTELNRILGDKAPAMTLIRPPFGGPWFSNYRQSRKDAMLALLQRRGLPMLWTWEGDSRDSADWTRGEWFEPNESYQPKLLTFAIKVERIKKQILQNALGGLGFVVLMHDIHPTSIGALPHIITELKQAGYRFATMEDYVKERWQKSSAQIVAELALARSRRK